jgi:hypothetical protein
MVLGLGEGHMPGNFFLSEPQVKTTVSWFSSNFFRNKTFLLLKIES